MQIIQPHDHGVDLGKNFKHGLFGEFKLDNDEGILDVEEMELEDVKKLIDKRAKAEIDIFRTAISLNVEDAVELRIYQ